MSVGRYQIGLCTQYTSPLLITITVHWNLCSTNDRELFQPSTARVCLNRIVKGVGRFRDRLSLLPSFICYVNGSSQDIQVCKLISILLVPWLVGYLIHICFFRFAFKRGRLFTMDEQNQVTSKLCRLYAYWCIDNAITFYPPCSQKQKWQRSRFPPFPNAYRTWRTLPSIRSQ